MLLLMRGVVCDGVTARFQPIGALTLTFLLQNTQSEIFLLKCKELDKNQSITLFTL